MPKSCFPVANQLIHKGRREKEKRRPRTRFENVTPCYKIIKRKGKERKKTPFSRISNYALAENFLYPGKKIYVHGWAKNRNNRKCSFPNAKFVVISTFFPRNFSCFLSELLAVFRFISSPSIFVCWKEIISGSSWLVFLSEFLVLISQKSSFSWYTMPTFLCNFVPSLSNCHFTWLRTIAVLVEQLKEEEKPMEKNLDFMDFRKFSIRKIQNTRWNKSLRQKYWTPKWKRIFCVLKLLSYKQHIFQK